MDLGKFSVSLAVKDLTASREFYEKLGFSVIDGNADDHWLIMRSPSAVIGLFQGMFENNILTFNPSDVRRIETHLKAEGIDLIEESKGEDGPAHITLTDPDGNAILMDQHPADYKPKVKDTAGKIAWVDLTVPDAEPIRDFYQAVVGWQSSAVNQGDYDDYNMTRDGKPTTGICHQQGANKDIPSQWMVYFTVDDYDKSLAEVTAKGGKIIVPTRGEDGQRFAIIEDPAGAVCAIYES